jgi:drug/metabolite transporter (DMT)-like permease
MPRPPRLTWKQRSILRFARLLPGGRTRAILALITTNVIWGTTFVATKPMLDRVPPLTLATARFAIAVLVLLPVLAMTGRRPNLSRKAALMGFIGVFLVYVCQNMGLELTSASNGALIHGGIPALTMLIAVPILAERVDARRLIGMILSLIGVSAVILLGPVSHLDVAVLGDFLILLSAVALALYLVLGRRMFHAGGSLSLIAGISCYGLLILLPASVIEIGVRGLPQPTGVDLIRLGYLGAAASAAAFLLWGYGLRYLEAGQAAIFANLNPLVGVAAAAVLLGEPVTAAQIGGGTLIIGGVWLAMRQPWRPVPVVQPCSALLPSVIESTSALEPAPALALIQTPRPDEDHRTD